MNLSGFDLNLLLALDAVLAERSVTRAAHRLHVTPSAISNSLARLRAIMKDPLVVKSGRGIAPTPRAAALAPALGRALQELDRTVHGDVFDARTENRQFTLATADSGQTVRVPRLVAAFATEMPLARLRIVGIDTFLSSGGLAGSEVDLAVVGVAETGPGLHATPLYHERAVLVARRGHAMTRVRVTKARLTSLRHVDVQVAPGHGFQALASAYARLGVQRDVAVVVPSFATAAALVSHSNLVATVPEGFVDRFGDSFAIRRLAGSIPNVTVSIQMAWHERTDHDPAMRALRALVVKTMGGAKPRGRSKSL